MRQLVRGERAAVSELAAINHLWEVEIAIEAPVYIVDFCCLGLDESGEIVGDEFVINLNRPEAPRGAIRLDNASNNGAIFSLAFEELPPRVRRLVFTATVGENPLPGGLVGAAFSLLGVHADIGAGQIVLSTPVAPLAWFEFSGQDFGDEHTLIIGEFYLRDEWRFVAAGQPLRGDLGAFLRTLTDGPTPAPLPVPRTLPPSGAPPLLAPARPPRPVPPTPIRASTRPAPPVLAPPRPPIAPRAAPPISPSPISPSPISPTAPLPTPPIPAPRRNVAPLAPAPATITIPAAPGAIPVATPLVAPVPAPVAIPVAPLNLPQIVPPGGKLQDLIDAAAPASTLILQRGEYPGPIVISKALTFEGQGSAIWGKSGPLVTLASSEVSLHDLDLEITVSSDDPGTAGVVLRVEKSDVPLHLESVQLRGRVSGLGASDGAWKVPRALDLGEFAARADNEFHFFLEVPGAATLHCEVGGIEISPSEVEAGAHRITLSARDLAPDTLLVGELEVRTPTLAFTVALRGSSRTGLEASRDHEIG